MPGRTHSREFKLEIVHQINGGQQTTAQLSRAHTLSPSLIHRWRKEVEARGDAAFTDHTTPEGSLEQRRTRAGTVLRAVVTGEHDPEKVVGDVPLESRHQMIREAHSTHPEVSVRRLCELHGVSRSWFYEQRGREEVDADQPLVEAIEAVVEEFSGYGYRRVAHELARRGRRVNHKRVLRVMRERRLLCRPKRRFRATTNSNHHEPRFPNLLREVIPVQPDQVWQADLTYLRVQRGFVDLACVLDSFTREVVGWSISKFLDAELPLAALNQALATRRPAPGLLHHSDQGVQYASRVYIDRLRSAGIVPSMSRTGNPYDNAKMESFYKTLKSEEVDLQAYVDLDDARRHIGFFIADLYNRRRLHSSLGYVSPAEFAARYTATQR